MCVASCNLANSIPNTTFRCLCGMLGSYFVLGIDHGAIVAPSVRLQVSYPKLLHQHSSWWHCDLNIEEYKQGWRCLCGYIWTSPVQQVQLRDTYSLLKDHQLWLLCYFIFKPFPISLMLIKITATVHQCSASKIFEVLRIYSISLTHHSGICTFLQQGNQTLGENVNP